MEFSNFLNEGIFGERIYSYAIKAMDKGERDKLKKLKNEYNFALSCHSNFLQELKALLSDNGVDFEVIVLRLDVFDAEYLVLTNKKHKKDDLLSILK